MKNIYVGNISYATTEEQLTQLFATYGAVQSAKVVQDARSGRSKGFAFVEMADEGAEAAIEAINGTELDGRTLRVAEANSPNGERSEGPRPPRRSGPPRGGRDGQGRRGPGGGHGHGGGGHGRSGNSYGGGGGGRYGGNR